jgi:hypothetical protein
MGIDEDFFDDDELFWLDVKLWLFSVIRHSIVIVLVLYAMCCVQDVVLWFMGMKG